MILIDTGYLIALLRPRDALHDRARRWSAALTDRTMVTEYVLMETAASLSPPSERLRAERFIRNLIDHSQTHVVWASQRLFRDALHLYRDRHDKFWSLADCASFALMHQHGIRQALSYDSHFTQAGFDPLLRRDPA